MGVANCHRITSPVIPLEDAVALRSRLMHARASSWELLRAEWLELLQRGKYSRSLKDAEDYLHQARTNFLEQQLPHAVGLVERALDAQDRIESKVKSRMEKRRDAKQATKAPRQ